VTAQSANTLHGSSPVSHYQLLKIFNFVNSNRVQELLSIRIIINKH